MNIVRPKLLATQIAFGIGTPILLGTTAYYGTRGMKQDGAEELSSPIAAAFVLSTPVAGASMFVQGLCRDARMGRSASLFGPVSAVAGIAAIASPYVGSVMAFRNTPAGILNSPDAKKILADGNERKGSQPLPSNERDRPSDRVAELATKLDKHYTTRTDAALMARRLAASPRTTEDGYRIFAAIDRVTFRPELTVLTELALHSKRSSADIERFLSTVKIMDTNTQIAFTQFLFGAKPTTTFERATVQPKQH
jgi:hypothetical protein